MHAKALTLAGLGTMIAALAVAAGGAAAGTPTVQPVHFNTTYATSACGMDNLALRRVGQQLRPELPAGAGVDQPVRHPGVGRHPALHR